MGEVSDTDNEKTYKFPEFLLVSKQSFERRRQREEWPSTSQDGEQAGRGHERTGDQFGSTGQRRLVEGSGGGVTCWTEAGRRAEGKQRIRNHCRACGSISWVCVRGPA